MSYILYFIINEERTKTYTGFTGNLEQRKMQHQKGKIKSTKSFGNFELYILEKVEIVESARKREKYWKSATGRRKLKQMFFSN